MSDSGAEGTQNQERGSSPVGRGGAGTYIEGELGAYYLLAMLAGSEPRGLPGTRLHNVRFQGVDLGYTLDDLILEGTGPAGDSLLEIQSKRTVTFAPKDGVFQEVCAQVARTTERSTPEERHFLAVATQRTSQAISGPYQDVLQWAHTAATSAEFFKRLSDKGVANKAMRDFVATFRANLIAGGVEDDDDVIWRVLRRFLILEFDFESSAPMARAHALLLARQVLSDEDLSRAEALWSNLIEISIAIGKGGGSLDRQSLSAKLVNRGFRLAGDRKFSLARARLAEMARLALANIGNTIAGMQLPRLDAVAALDDAMDHHRIVEIRAGPGVGKSAVLRHFAERVSRQSHVIVLDPVATPEGGWSAFAQLLGVSTTAKEFLSDLAASGGGVLFIDSLDMFTEPGRRRTVNDLLRELSTVEGFSVIATVRPEFGNDGESWLAEDALAVLGPVHTVTVGELQDAEVEMLGAHAPELRALLASGHPAADIARNLYRLSRLLKVPNSAVIRTEAMLADHWWRTADGVPEPDVRAAQRILADLADSALTGQDTLEMRTDSPARLHLLRSLTLRETKRDNLGFYHDVLRDWAVASRIYEDSNRLARLDLSAPVSPRIARGIELAGRLALESQEGCAGWQDLLIRLSPTGSHGSWRRHALMAIVRSELGAVLLERCSGALLAEGGLVFRELCTAIVAVDTVATADLLKGADLGEVAVPRSLRTNTTGSAARLLRWCVGHASDVPLQAIGAVIDLLEIQHFTLRMVPRLAEAVAKMLFGWLLQMDTRSTKMTIRSDDRAGLFDGQAYSRLVEDVRMWSLLLANYAPDETKAYLLAITAERASNKVKAIRPFSSSIVQVAPAELADLIADSLIDLRKREDSYGGSRGSAFSFTDSDYLPSSPSQPPFLAILEVSPEIGLALIRRLVQEAVDYHSDSADPGANGFTLMFDNRARLFPWEQTYLWSRDQAREYSAASGLKALEAWGHARLDAGESVEAVLADVLGPEGSCAAYLLVAVDLLISHWPASREALMPFIACPQLLATERQRVVHDQMRRERIALDREPAGKVRLADLATRPSREISLEGALIGYLADDPVSSRVRTQLKAAVDALGGFDDDADFGDPAFMGAYALNMLDPENWIEVEGGRAYRSPPAEAEHLERLKERSNKLVRSSEIEAKVRLAIDDSARGSPEIAREAADYAAAGLPDGSDTDVLKARSTRLVATAMLVARDGDDLLLDEQEQWVRTVIDRTLAEETDRHRGSGDMLQFNRPAIATCALIHLWHRKRMPADRDTLIDIAIRSDCPAPTAIAAALDVILATDSRLLKAAMRAAFASYRWRRHRWDEDASKQERFKQRKAAEDAQAVAAEVAWLDGGPEPEWPAFPEERPHLRHPIRLRVPGAQTERADLTDPSSTPAPDVAPIYANSEAAARWLQILTSEAGSRLGWRGEIVDAYAVWSATTNGYGLSPEAEIDRHNRSWNDQFYTLLSIALMDMSPERFEEQLQFVTSLPDQSFGDAAEALIHAADVSYFNDARRSAERAVELRERIVRRTTELRRWERVGRPGNLSVDYDTGGIVAKLLMNTHNPIGGTRSYLVQAVFDRVDPLLDTLRPLLPGGPTAFVALCTMNMLLVAPRARHIDFLLSGVEAWYQRLPTDQAMWITLGIGQKVIDWFEKVLVEEPALLSGGHPYRGRIDAALSRLVGLGVGEAHDLEKRIEHAQGAAGTVSSE